MRSLRIVITFVLAWALAACASSPSKTIEPDSVELRWGDEPYKARPMQHMIMVEPHGSNDLWLRYKRPPGVHAVHIEVWQKLVEARTGQTVLFDGTQRFDIAALPEGTDPIELHYVSKEPFRVYNLAFGTLEELFRADLVEDAGNVIAGIVLFIVGSIALVVFVFSRRSAPVAWLAAFAVASGIVQFSQTSVRLFVLAAPEVWRGTAIVGVAAYLVTFAMLVDSLFGLHDRVLRALVTASLVAVVVWAIGVLVGRPHLELTRRILYVLIGIGLVDVIARTGALAIRGNDTARLFVVGFAGMMAFTIPDMIWGWGYQVLPFNTAPFGTLFFATFVALILERRFRKQREALEHNVVDLETRGAQVQRLNAELRRQIAARSRELAQVINNPELRTSANLRAGASFGGRYTLLEQLGQGGMGTVYRAERKTDAGVDLVALKVMAGSTSPEDATRFAREAEIASQLDHENLVTVLDVGFSEGMLYLVMELVDGPSLEDLRDRFGDVELVVPILAQVAHGLAVLHAAGIVHRDLKPPNVLIAKVDSRAVAKITDFGISRRSDLATSSEVIAVTERRLTQAGAVMGTPLYMAPETMKGAALVDARADVFAFGVMAYELLTSARPFRVAPGLSVVVTGTLPPPPSLAALGLVPIAVAELLDRCILQDPAQRPTAQELASALA